MKNVGTALALAAALGIGAFTLTTDAEAGRYEMAGCGLGSLVFGPDGEMPDAINDVKVRNVLMATTNGTSGSQTFGITTGTSNCTQDGVMTSSKEALAFAEVNLEDLSRDMATGSGEYLVSFASLMGCSADAAGHFGDTTQAAYETIFPSTQVSAGEVVASVQNVVRGDQVLAASCTL